MKTWERFGFDTSDGTLYIGSAEQLEPIGVDEKLRIMREADFKKREAERRMYKRVFDAAMNWYIGIQIDSFDVESKKYLAFKKIMDKARGSTKR